MRPVLTFRNAARAATLLLIAAIGCGDMNFDWFKKKREPEPEPKPAARQDPIIAGTIGERIIVADSQPMRVRGFGVVIGLGDRGGGDAPTVVREYLVDYLSREAASARSSGRRWPSVQKLLDSPDTAIVGVYGFVPAGATEGTPFDVQVEALGTQAQSLEGGVLLQAELKQWDASATGTGLIGGRTLAKARGLVFTNPFSETERKTGRRKGWVLSGGRATENRGFRFVLEEPSYTMARRIQDRLNERFSQTPKIAIAQSQGFVQVRTPPAYLPQPEQFAALASHVLIDNAPALVGRRLQELIGEAGRAGARLEEISLIWEGMARTVLPQIQPLYSNSDPSVAYYAARAGLRLRDMSAFATVAATAAAPGHPQRLLAVRELGNSGLVQAGSQLLPLVNGDDQELRIAAYEALLELRHPAVRTFRFPHPLDPGATSMLLDIVSTSGKPLIYVRRTKEPRIAVFGAKMPVNPPLFYSHPQDWVTVNAKDAASDLTVFCRTRQSNRLSDTLKVPSRVDELIRALAAPPIADDNGTVKGLGLHYSLVIEVRPPGRRADADG
ncbi:MAG: flagellar basal body P-ring protein FlgI [Planctomycetes bacterium]|nr:flagellar basal body P-ring protein FlgI [Planctomycetota bacterium]